MPSLNKVFLMGHLTRDPELKYSPSGVANCKLGMAINRSYMKGDEWKTEVCFVDVVCFKDYAEKAGQYGKGDMAIIEGRLSFQQWESQGQKRSKHEVVAERIQFVQKSKVRETPPVDPDEF